MYSGLLQTINGVLMLWNDLKDKQTYLLTSHLNQDPLENQFSIVRNNRGSYEKNPTAFRFVKNISLCIFQNIQPPRTSGYETPETQNLFSLEKLNNFTPLLEGEEEEEEVDTQQTTIDNEVFHETSNVLSDVPEDFSEIDWDDDVFECQSDERCNLQEKTPLENLKSCSLAYLSGFIAYRIKKFNCTFCNKYSSIEEDTGRLSTTLVRMRAYKCSNEPELSTGHLCIPSEQFETDFNKIISVFEENVFNFLYKDNVVLNIFNVLNKKDLKIPNCHKQEIIKYIATLLIRFQLRKCNNKLKETKLNKEKLQNFKGI